MSKYIVALPFTMDNATLLEEEGGGIKYFFHGKNHFDGSTGIAFLGKVLNTVMNK